MSDRPELLEKVSTSDIESGGYLRRELWRAADGLWVVSTIKHKQGTWSIWHSWYAYLFACASGFAFLLPEYRFVDGVLYRRWINGEGGAEMSRFKTSKGAALAVFDYLIFLTDRRATFDGSGFGNVVLDSRGELWGIDHENALRPHDENFGIGFPDSIDLYATLYDFEAWPISCLNFDRVNRAVAVVESAGLDAISVCDLKHRIDLLQKYGFREAWERWTTCVPSFSHCPPQLRVGDPLIKP